MANKHLLSVHFQFMPGDRELAEKLFQSKAKPFLASIVPNLLVPSMRTAEGEGIFDRIHFQDNYYPEWAIELFMENRDNPNVFWIQEGYRHCCGRCFNLREGNREAGKGNFPDPHHEHVCPDKHSQSLAEQVKVISEGRNLVKNMLGINPGGYCPPNHLYNDDTISAVAGDGFSYFLTRNGFDYFAPGLVSLPAYVEDRGLVVIPETKYERGKSPALMVYYHDLANSFGKNPRIFSELLSSSQSLFELGGLSEEPRTKAKINQQLIHTYKKLRDLKGRI